MKPRKRFDDQGKDDVFGFPSAQEVRIGAQGSHRVLRT